VAKMHPLADPGGMVARAAKKPRLGPGVWEPTVTAMVRGDGNEAGEEEDAFPDMVEDGPLDPEAKREAIRIARNHARDTLCGHSGWIGPRSCGKRRRKHGSPMWMSSSPRPPCAPTVRRTATPP